MEDLTLKEQRQQIRKWYLMTHTPLPEYLREENHICDPDAPELDPENCPACEKMIKKQLKQANYGKYR